MVGHEQSQHKGSEGEVNLGYTENSRVACATRETCLSKARAGEVAQWKQGPRLDQQCMHNRKYSESNYRHQARNVIAILTCTGYVEGQ